MTSVGQQILRYIEFPSTYQRKDAVKFNKANKLIARGNGSSGLYARICADICNTGSYNNKDIVAISVNGARKGRKDFNQLEVMRAIEANSTIITDNAMDRVRRYNIGERNLAKFLIDNGYSEEKGTGIWKKN